MAITNRGVGSARMVRCLGTALASISLFAFSGAAQGKPPLIIIPGLTGSEMINSRTGEKVWVKARRSKVDDLRLPLSANLAANRDSLVPGDIIRSIKLGILPRSDIYGGLIEALETKAGYKEGKWDAPPPRGYEDTIYVFPYDWRRDNVENARLLVRRVEELKRRLKKPNLKFDIISHSMGGLIARYAVMYGNVDLPAGDLEPKPTWAGSKDFGRIIMLGTPNEGSTLAFQSLVNGVALFGININLPFIQNFSRFDFFTIPALFELLPPNGSLRLFDENLKPIAVDLYDPETWTSYGWDPREDKKFDKEFGAVDKRRADAYFAAVLKRAKKFQDALGAGTKGNPSVVIEIAGSECKDTPDGALVYQEQKKGDWKTIFKPVAIATSSGKKISPEELKPLLQGPGDSVVSKRSLLGLVLSPASGVESSLFQMGNFTECEEHNKLPSNPNIQNYVISILAGNKK
jgi:pimeloyl-ACP methyl ester carboxylesterase